LSIALTAPASSSGRSCLRVINADYDDMPTNLVNREWYSVQRFGDVGIMPFMTNG
jgi:hypothetical protein